MARTIARRELLSPGDRVLVALSAGPDSTALVAALAALRDRGAVAGLCALHVDHGLRSGGAEDGAHAARTCAALGVPFESVRVAVAAGNVQAEARRARYRALAAAAERHGCSRIATGHTRTDQAETFLLRALRGAGARGLASIPPRRGAIVRPLIDATRGEVLEYLAARGLGWREDPTNASPRFARNALRLELLPVLRRLEPAFERTLARAADLLRADEGALARRARRLAGGTATVEVAALGRAPVAVGRRVVRLLWRRAAPGRRALSAQRIDEVLALCARGRVGRVTLPEGLEARVAAGRLALGSPERRDPPTRRPAVSVPGPGTYSLAGVIVEVALGPADGSPAPPWPLLLRTRREGDRIRPRGAPGGKRLKAWLIDRKVPREARDRLLVLADAAGNVLSLPELGVRSALAGRLRVTAVGAAGGAAGGPA